MSIYCQYCQINIKKYDELHQSTTLKASQLIKLQQELDLLHDEQQEIRKQLKPQLKEKLKYQKTQEKELEIYRKQCLGLEEILRTKEQIIKLFNLKKKQPNDRSKACFN